MRMFKDYEYIIHEIWFEYRTYLLGRSYGPFLNHNRTKSISFECSGPYRCKHIWHHQNPCDNPVEYRPPSKCKLRQFMHQARDYSLIPLNSSEHDALHSGNNTNNGHVYFDVFENQDKKADWEAFKKIVQERMRKYYFNNDGSVNERTYKNTDFAQCTWREYRKGTLSPEDLEYYMEYLTNETSRRVPDDYFDDDIDDDYDDETKDYRTDDYDSDYDVDDDIDEDNYGVDEDYDMYNDMYDEE